VSTVQEKSAPTITTPQRLEKGIWRRAVSSVCGYVDGDASIFDFLSTTLGISTDGDLDSPVSCGGGFSCVTNIDNIVRLACCNDLTCTSDYRTCSTAGETLLGCGGELDPCTKAYTSVLAW
jgi:hypothetical protein